MPFCPPGGGGGGVMGRRHVAAAAALNTVTPCAACKLLRRRCAEECPFSPYFSPHEPHKFAAVHRVFGASNVSKMLMEVPENQRADAANSLVYEANLRLRDPVYGCMGAILTLQHHIQSLQADLSSVRSHILRYKYLDATSAADSLISHNNNNTAVAASMVPEVSVVTAPPPQPTPAPPLTSPSLSVVVSSSTILNSSSVITSSYNVPSSSTAAGYSNSMSAQDNVHYFD